MGRWRAPPSVTGMRRRSPAWCQSPSTSSTWSATGSGPSTLETVAALEDLSVWQRELQGLANGEVGLECPACGDHVYLEFVGDDIVATADPDDIRKGRLSGRLGHKIVSVEFLHLFGMFICPHCGTQRSIADAIA
jgi:predicted RNA-binding Zn-ribbon protein involved in translation (DUF1610 family)